MFFAEVFPNGLSLGPIAVNILTALVVAVITAGITARLALKRFRSQQWWAIKAQAYGDIINALYDLTRWGDMEMGMQLGPQVERTEFHKKLKEKSEEASERLLRAANTSSFLFSKEAQQILDELREGLQTAGKAAPHDWYTFVFDYVDAARRCLDKLPTAARRELSVKRL